MPDERRAGLGRAAIAGIVAGALVLGVGGRLAMAALPLATGAPPRFSWGGSLEVIALGAGYGLGGGIVLAVLRRFMRGAPALRGAALGLVMLGVAWATSSVGRSTARTAPVSMPSVVLISAILFLGFGFLAERLAGDTAAPPDRL